MHGIETGILHGFAATIRWIAVATRLTTVSTNRRERMPAQRPANAAAVFFFNAIQ